MNKKELLILGGIIGALLVVLSLVFACAAPASTPTASPKPAPSPTAASSPTAPSPTASPTPTTPVKPIMLRVAGPTASPMAPNSQVAVRWADWIEKQSGGRLKLQLYFTETLVKATEAYRAIQTGVADIGYVTIGADISLTPLSTITRLPFVGIPSPAGAGTIWWTLYNKFPEIQKEWPGMKALVVNGLPPDQFHFTKKDVRLPPDIKGLKIIARGEWIPVVISLGASPVELTPPDWYTGLDRGLVEGQVIHFLAADTFKLLPMYNYNLVLGDGGVSVTNEMYLINQSTWDGLPPDLQKILLDSVSVYTDDALKTNDRLQQAAIQKTKDLKKAFYYATLDEIKSWQDAGKVRINSWITENKAKGLPAQAIYDELQQLLKTTK